jgi:hypothetical protein
MLRVGSSSGLKQHEDEGIQSSFIAVGGMSVLRDGEDVQIQYGQSADEGEHLLWHIEDAGGEQTPFDIIVVVGGLLPL